MKRASLLTIVPVTFAQACEFVAEHHRHLPPPPGHKFTAGVIHASSDVLVGVVIVGRPVARHFDDGQTLEVTRTATDGTRNACSALYGAAWRAAQALGYTRLITYTQPERGETGASLRAAGWTVVAQRQRHSGWDRKGRPRTDHGSAGVQRTLWEAPRAPGPAEDVVAALLEANCCHGCGADVGHEEIGSHRGGLCWDCSMVLDQGLLELFDIDPDALCPRRPVSSSDSAAIRSQSAHAARR